MKIIHFVPFLFVLVLTSAFAQKPPDSNGIDSIRTIRVDTPGDGFIMRGNDAVMIRNGAATKINAEVVLPNGVRVQANGAVTLHDGSNSVLRNDKLLTFEGRFVDVPRAEQGVTSPSSAPAASPANAPVGISARDGITVSGADVLITRNGVTQKVTSQVELPNGVIAKADGSVLLRDGKKIVLRPDQVLDLQGVLHDAPPRPNPPGLEPSTNPSR